MLSFIDSLTALRRGRHSSLEARTSSRRLRHATPQVETLENIVSLSLVIQNNIAVIIQIAAFSHNVQQVATVVQANANNGSALTSNMWGSTHASTIDKVIARVAYWAGRAGPHRPAACECGWHADDGWPGPLLHCCRVKSGLLWYTRSRMSGSVTQHKLVAHACRGVGCEDDTRFEGSIGRSVGSRSAPSSSAARPRAGSP